MKAGLKIIVFILSCLWFIYPLACSQNKIETTSELQIIEHTLNLHSFTDVLRSQATIDGRVQNISNNPINSANITAHFFDKDGNLLYTGSTVLQNLQPSEIRIFSVQFNSPDAWKSVKYDISASVP